MSLHPVSRILSFLIIVVFLAVMQLPGILLLTLIFLVFAAQQIRTHYRKIIQFAWQLRWFWLSILLLYSLLPLNGTELGTFSAEFFVQGMLHGLTRCLALMLIIMYFVVLIHPIPLQHLQQAWSWLMRPLRFVGISPDILSMRIALTFHAVRELQSHSVQAEKKLSLRQLPEQLFGFLQLALERSARPADAIQLLSPVIVPGILQWLFLAVLICLLTLILLLQPMLNLDNISW